MNLKRIQDTKQNIQDIVIQYQGESVETILKYLKENNPDKVLVRLDYPDKGGTITFDEVDLYCSKLHVKDYSIEEKDDFKFATISCDKESALNLCKLFINLGKLGNSGHSYSVLIGDYTCGHDGDGSDYIKKVGGKELTREFINNPYKWNEILEIYESQESL